VPAAEAAELLATYNAQLRAHIPDRLPPHVTVSHDGPITRITGYGPGGWAEYHDLDGLEGDALDDLIARQVEFFRDLDMRFEWKLHGHDLPADLPARLVAAGFVPRDQETVVVAPIERIPLDSPAPEGITVRELADPGDYRRIADLEAAVWGEEGSHGWIDSLAGEKAADPDGIAIFLAVTRVPDAGGPGTGDPGTGDPNARDEIATSAGWIRFPSGTEFGTLWGGSTRPDWRRRGIYRALVARRAAAASARGCRYLQVDASDDSRPILVRLGFVPVTTTTPYIWTPPGH